MEIEHPITGEVIDTDKNPETWVPVALQWVRQCNDMRAMHWFLKARLGALVPGNKRTEHYDHGGARFSVEQPRPRFDRMALEEVYEMQQGLSEDKRPVVKREAFDVSLSALKKLDRTAGPLSEAVKARLRQGEQSPGAPQIKLTAPVDGGAEAES